MADDDASSYNESPCHWRVQGIRFMTALERAGLLPACAVVYDGADIEDLVVLSHMFPCLNWVVRKSLMGEIASSWAEAVDTDNFYRVNYGTIQYCGSDLFETAPAPCVLLSRETDSATRVARLDAVRPLRALLLYERPDDDLLIPRGTVYDSIHGDPYVYVDTARGSGMMVYWSQRLRYQGTSEAKMQVLTEYLGRPPTDSELEHPRCYYPTLLDLYDMPVSDRARRRQTPRRPPQWPRPRQYRSWSSSC